MRIPNSIKTTSWHHDFFPLFLYNTTKYLKPELCVELGTLAGYSAYCIASAMLDNKKGHIECYDLWEAYPYNHVTLGEATNNLMGLPVVLKQGDAYKAVENYKDNTVDLMMVDISNDGETYRKILNDWYKKLTSKANILLEGGCVERDEVEWMKKYNKVPINPLLKDKELTRMYNLTNVGCFPSITIAQRKV